MLIRHWRSDNSLATTQYSQAKFCLFPERALPFHDNPPVTSQSYSATPLLNENLAAEKEMEAAGLEGERVKSSFITACLEH